MAFVGLVDSLQAHECYGRRKGHFWQGTSLFSIKLFNDFEGPRSASLLVLLESLTYCSSGQQRDGLCPFIMLCT